MQLTELLAKGQFSLQPRQKPRDEVVATCSGPCTGQARVHPFAVPVWHGRLIDPMILRTRGILLQLPQSLS
jgi:hypothetical protein